MPKPEKQRAARRQEKDPRRTPEQLDAEARITESDIDRANRNAPDFLKPFLEATPEN